MNKSQKRDALAEHNRLNELILAARKEQKNIESREPEDWNRNPIYEVLQIGICELKKKQKRVSLWL